MLQYTIGIPDLSDLSHQIYTEEFFSRKASMSWPLSSVTFGHDPEAINWLLSTEP